MANIKFKKPDWIRHTGIYEVNLRQYTSEGTFIAFSDQLPRLKDMGVETLWFMPLTPIAEKNRKGSLGSYYACSDYVSINPEFGTINDFKDLVKKAQLMGFTIILDWVANHTGWDHVWTISHPEYYRIDEATNDFKMASGMDDIIELDHNNPALREAMIIAMEFWVRECNIDGFRCDLAFWVDLEFWIAARTSLEKIKNLFWLGEFDPLENPAYYDCFDAAYTWKWMHKTEEFCKKQVHFELLAEVLSQYEKVCGKENIPLWFTANHDENSWNGTEFEKYGEMAKVFAVFSFTWDGMPMIYSGQELPNTRRLAFFDKDIIEWNGNYLLHDFYKVLSKLKKNSPALSAADENAGTHLLSTTAPGSIFGFIRKNGDDEIVVLLNMTGTMINFKVSDEQLWGYYFDVFDKKISKLTSDHFFELQPHGYLVYERISQAQ
jgi:glycosidase